MLTIKTRKKRSKIWLLPEEEFLSLIKKSRSVKEALNYFGLENKGSNFRTIKQRISELNIDISHFLNNVEASNLARKLSKTDFEQTWLIENSSRSRTHLKQYLVKFNLLDYKCYKCGNLGIWMDEIMTLQLEHVNGISNDNRLENLCFLCPNCHSQTSSFAGKKNKKHSFCACGKTKHKLSNNCAECNKNPNRVSHYKIEWPTIEYFQSNLWKIPTTQIAKDLGVSDKAVEKYIKKLGLSKPPRGYWSKNGGGGN